MTDISLTQAEDVSALAIEHGASIGVAAMSVVVLDRSGTIRVLKRSDSGSLLGPDIALAKARSAMAFSMPTLKLNANFGENPTVTSAVAAATNGRFLPLGGGVPVFDPEIGLIGAVGVAGSTQENDHAIAERAIVAAGLLSSL